MPYIVQNLLAGDTRLQLGAEEITRPIGFGSQWTKIRIGVRMACLVGSTFAGPGFYCGVCVGSKGFKAIDCTDAVGAWLGTVNPMDTQTYTYNAQGYTTAFGVGSAKFRKVGASITAVSNIAGSYNFSIVAYPLTNTNYSGFYLDILRLSPTLTRLSSWGQSSNAAIYNLTRSQHLANMENEQTLTASGQALTPSGDENIATTNAAWDTVFVGWGRSVPVLEIRDLTVLRIY